MHNRDECEICKELNIPDLKYEPEKDFYHFVVIKNKIYPRLSLEQKKIYKTIILSEYIEYKIHNKLEDEYNENNELILKIPTPYCILAGTLPEHLMACENPIFPKWYISPKFKEFKKGEEGKIIVQLPERFEKTQEELP